MATITQIEDAKMSARAKVSRWSEEYKRKFFEPKRRQALAAKWLSLSPAEREAAAREYPEAVHEIMRLMQKGKR